MVMIIQLAADRHPTKISIDGSPVVINEAGKPLSWLSEWMKEEGTVLIDKKAMTVEEDRLQAAFRLTYLDKLAQLAASADPTGQVLDRVWLFEEYVKAGGEQKDVELAIIKGGGNMLPTVPPGGAQGMPGPINQQPPISA
jgi:hypothetical protein